jgi:YidC/Oxa1 family membrane protein insertase
LQEKFKDDPQGLQQAKLQLMIKNGANPAAQMGGCLLLFAQMPIFMGLYFCLQESAFFRNQSLLWAPNLAAPDMLAWVGEGVPFVTDPANVGGVFYLGPYLNVLPIIATALIFLQQYITMPPPTDEQQEMQQRMMKIMVAVMAVFFYKVPAGLSLYFICSTSWALMERQLIPKPKANQPPPPDAADKPAEAGLIGRFRARMQDRLADMQRQADEQARRQVRNADAPTDPDRRDRKKKRKKR